MTRQETIEEITERLHHLDDDMLESVYRLLERVQPLDAWEEQIVRDSEVGRLDDLVEEALADYRAGRTSELVVK